MFNSTIAYLILKGKKVTPPQNIKVKKQMKKDDLFIFKHGVQTLGKYHTNQQIYVILKWVGIKEKKLTDGKSFVMGSIVEDVPRIP